MEQKCPCQMFACANTDNNTESSYSDKCANWILVELHLLNIQFNYIYNYWIKHLSNSIVKRCYSTTCFVTLTVRFPFHEITHLKIFLTFPKYNQNTVCIMTIKRHVIKRILDDNFSPSFHFIYTEIIIYINPEQNFIEPTGTEVILHVPWVNYRQLH